jgi:hypothetical protein
MCPDPLGPHDRQHRYRHRHRAEEIRLKLEANLLQPQIFDKACDRESRIVDQHIDSPALPHDAVDQSRDGVHLSDVQLPHLDLVGNARRPGGLLQGSPPSQVAHGGHDSETLPCQFHSRQQPEAARCAGDHCNLVGHRCLM